MGEASGVLREAAEGASRRIVRVPDAPIVRRDIIGYPASCVPDAPLTRAGGDLVKVVGCYDNERGHANRLLVLTEYVVVRSSHP
ncbi:aldehyde dehydrogenase [Streptomyces venezuelae]|uniref:aldehyde dehydrogenase n=1 Tax=Streptomyces venezuelae TaxID=54571 RepID=UPI00378CBB2F